MAVAGDQESIDLDNPPFPLTAKDRKQLSTRDEDFHRLTWEDLKTIIARNALKDLLRLPSDLRRYLLWSQSIRQHYSSTSDFVITERLRWTPLPHDEGPPQFAHESTVPFQDPRDYAILVNDWPYGVDHGIVHLIAWTKVPIPVSAQSGDLTMASRCLVHDFVRRSFVRHLEAGWDQVLWFKNWSSLQSVRGVDHVHILVRGASQTLLEHWTVRRD